MANTCKNWIKVLTQSVNSLIDRNFVINLHEIIFLLLFMDIILTSNLENKSEKEINKITKYYHENLFCKKFPRYYELRTL